MIFEQEVSIFNPNALHSRFTRLNTQIQQTSRNIALIATKEELLESSVSGKSFLETSKGYIDVRADSIISMVQARRLGGTNLLYNTGNPTNPNDIDTTGMSEEERQNAINEATQDSYKYLVAGTDSFSAIEKSTYWNENVFSRTLASSSGAIYSSRARLKNPDNLYTFSCDFRQTSGVSKVQIYFRWDIEGNIKTGTGYVTDTLLYDSSLGIDGVHTLEYQESDGSGGTVINTYGEEVYRRLLSEYGTTSSEKWQHIEIPFILTAPRVAPYPNSGYIYIYATGSNGAKLQVTHLQLEKGGVATSYEDSLQEAMEETYSKIEQTADSITSEVGNLDGRITSLTQTVNGLETRVQDAEGDISEVRQTANEISAGFNGNNILSLINDRDHTTATLDADVVRLTGTDSITLALDEKYNTSDFTGVKIAQAVNGSDSSVKIQADHIDITGQTTFTSALANAGFATDDDISDFVTNQDIVGFVTDDDIADFITADDLGANGTTVIDGGRILTGFIGNQESGNYWNLATGEVSLHGYATLEDVQSEVSEEIAKNIGILTVTKTLSNSSRTTYSAHVLKNGADVVHEYEDFNFEWRKVDGISMEETHLGVGKTWTIRPDEFEYGGIVVCYFRTFAESGVSASQGNLQDSKGKLRIREALTEQRVELSVFNNQILDKISESIVDYDLDLNQIKIFNRLTNNGEVQGIYLYNNKLYVNAEYIATGILADRQMNNFWNLDTGEFRLTGYATSSELEDLQDDLESQIDGKINTFYQSSDPSTNWTSAEKIAHTGDLWFRTSDSKTLRWNGSSWQEQSVPTSITNAINNKSTIYYGTTSGTYSGVSTGDYLVDSSSGNTYRWNGSSWVKQTDYNSAINSAISGLRSDLEGQIEDSKIETFYQSADPSTGWTSTQKSAHTGDLWYDTDDQKTYRWNGTAWQQQNVPTAVFDKIDGKTTIFYGTTSGTYTGVQTGDYLVDSNNGNTYRWNGTSWTKQTDYNTAISTAISGLRSDLESQIDEKIDTWYQSSDPSTNWTSAEKTAHTGDLWYKTTDQTTYRWNGSAWQQQNVPTDVFNKINGKSTIFYGTTSGTYTGVQTGDYLVDSSTGATYRYTGSAWSKVTDYKTAISTYDTSLNQQAIFNKLTNNGTAQGIYMTNGQLYVNGEYIKANSISADKITGVVSADLGAFHVENNDIISDNTIVSDGNSSSTKYYIRNYYDTKRTVSTNPVLITYDIGFVKTPWAFASIQGEFLSVLMGKTIDNVYWKGHDSNGNDVTSQLATVHEKIGNFGVNGSGDVYCHATYSDTVYTKNILVTNPVSFPSSVSTSSLSTTSLSTTSLTADSVTFNSSLHRICGVDFWSNGQIGWDDSNKIQFTSNGITFTLGGVNIYMYSGASNEVTLGRYTNGSSGNAGITFNFANGTYHLFGRSV